MVTRIAQEAEQLYFHCGILKKNDILKMKKSLKRKRSKYRKKFY